MAKWLAAGGVALAVVLFLLWRQLDSADAAAPATQTKPTPVSTQPRDALAEAKKVAAEEHAKAGVVEPVKVASADGKPEKVDVQSDEFFYRFQEVVPAVLSRKAAACYEGRSDAQRLNRNQKLTLEFHIKIKDGEVTVSDVHPSANTIKDPALEICFTQAVMRSGWHDDTLPDWEADDQLVIRPERGLKKYMKSNIEYVGAPAPRADDDVIRPGQKDTNGNE